VRQPWTRQGCATSSFTVRSMTVRALRTIEMLASREVFRCGWSLRALRPSQAGAKYPAMNSPYTAHG
jgi:hypothetical protein